jgi:hypothetical protein
VPVISAKKMMTVVVLGSRTVEDQFFKEDYQAGEV